jgi:hypothetical protein
VIQDLNNANEEIRTTSAWVLGKASQNNALVQNQVSSCLFVESASLLFINFMQCP